MSLLRKPMRSEQTRVLQRRLSLRLFLSWAIFTVLFSLLAWSVNAFVAPALGDVVARATSEWTYFSKEEMSLSYCLRHLDGVILAVGTPGMDASECDEISKAVEARALDLSQNEVAVSNDRLLIEFSDLNPYEDVDEIPEENPLLVSIDGHTPEWTYLDLLRLQTVQNLLTQEDPLQNWQILQTNTGFEARDLHVYYTLRSLKIPLAIALYLAGCIVIVFLGYSRSLRYFDELSGAVAEMLKDKDKPVTLSSELLVTQYGLNEIRLASLADERAAKAAEQRKDELVAYLAHDIKTPLTSVMGYLMLLDEAADLPEEVRRRYIRIACEKTERLEGLIDEFFEITRYNLHAIPIERQNVDLLVLCQQVVDEFFPVCETAEISIKTSVAEGVSVFVDPDKLARALGNIMRNAVAYAEPKSVIKVEACDAVLCGESIVVDDEVAGSDGLELTDVGCKTNCKADDAVVDCKDADGAGVAGVDDGVSGLCIRISNKGKEISEVHLKSIFEKFYRADTSRSSKSGRSGLGLAIAKEIVEAHGGVIAASSKDGLTTFSVFIPR